MKIQRFLFIGFSFVLLLFLWQSLIFYWTQQSKFQETITTTHTFKEDLQNQKRNMSFLKIHEKELNYLNSKGWFFPKNRLIAAEKLELLQGNLKIIEIIFEPESQETFNSSFVFNVTKILIQFKAFAEEDIYIFMDKLLKEFPGVLVLHELHENREEEMLRGHLIFNWISFGKDHHEK